MQNEDKKVFTWVPLIEPSTQRKPKTRRVSFGDGYEQRKKDGLNSDLRTHSLRFRERDHYIDEIDRFLADHAGFKSFYYIHKDGKKRLYVCEDWTRTELDYQSSEISATFREVIQ